MSYCFDTGIDWRTASGKGEAKQLGRLRSDERSAAACRQASRCRLGKCRRGDDRHHSRLASRPLPLFPRPFQ